MTVLERIGAIAPEYEHVSKQAAPGPSIVVADAILKWYDIAPTGAPVEDDVRALAEVSLRQAARSGDLSLAGELGCRIGDPVSINEGFYGWFGNRGGWNSGMNAMSQNAGFAAGVSGGSEPAATPIGQIGVRAQISVVFDLLPRPR